MKKLILLIFLCCFYSCELELDKANPLENLVITTGFAQEIGTLYCKVQGMITTNEFNGVDNYGHCWSLQNNPTINDESTSFDEFKGTKSFESPIYNLGVNTSYYVRAYAVANETITYGDEIEVTTMWAADVPLVQTGGANFITTSSATIQGEIVEQGMSSVTKYGHCWSTSTSPTISGNKSEFSGGSTIGTFSTPLTDLSSNTKYYYRAYAENNQGLAYGSEQSFSTTSGEPTVTTGTNTNITATTIDLEGDITGIGDAPITQHGHCWSTSSNPTVNDDTTGLGSANLGSFTSNLSNLTQNTTYYYRAYATNSFGTVYGSSLSFSTTNGEPTVITGGISNISTTSVTLEGEITGEGEATITEHGHCWSTSPNPNINNTTPSTGGNATVGTFTSSVAALNTSTTYYYKAYATNSFGTAYGNQSTFTTSDGSPIVETLGNTFNSLNGTSGVSYTLTGEIISYGSAPITSMGIAFSTWDEPTSGGWVSPVIQNGTFTYTYNNFYHNTVYYYRAYAENAFGKSYGVTKSFRTPEYCYISNSSTQGAPVINATLNSTNTTVTVNITGWTGTNQVDDVWLYQNNTFITTFGQYLLITNGQRTFTLPSGLDVSDCYTIQISDGGPGSILMVSDPFTIE